MTPIIKPLLVEGPQDYQHPPEDKIDYNNQMIGVIFYSDYAAFDIMMSNGNHGSLNFTSKKEIQMAK